MSTSATTLVTVLCAITVMAVTASAAMSPVERQGASPIMNRPLQHGFAGKNSSVPISDKIIRKHALGTATPTQSPGTVVGATWYDCQHLGSMGRMIGWSRHGDPDTMIVHFSWMSMPGPVFFARQYRYDSWNAVTGSFGVETGLQSADDFAGFVGLDITEDSRAVIGGHNREWFDGFTDCHFYWDSGPGLADFSAQAQVPRNVAEYGGYPNQEVIWPKFRYQEGPGDTVLHVLALEVGLGPGHPRALYYFRKVGVDATGTWDYPPYIVDTVYTLAHDVAANDDGKVTLIWTANLPCPGDPCDTCSGYECWNFVQWDNDLYYQVSYDYGLSWEPRVNVSRNVDGEEGYRPYTDLSALITSDDNLHIVWGARVWPADANSGGQAGLLSGSIFHWSEDNPYIRTVHNFEWDQTDCSGGAWELQASKMSLSECNGKLYVLFVQFNDIPHGVYDDCAAEGNPGFPVGAANGDLYLTISGDWGLTWDDARNLTNSRTPGCDSTGGSGGPCDNDHWPSMARFGTDYVGDFSAAEIVVPAGSSDPGTYYLDVLYINDHSAGAVVEDEGFWAEAEVRWFRLPCVDPISNPSFSIPPGEISYPSWSKHGVQHDVQVTIVNSGNAVLNYVITLEEDIGPAGWLSYSGFSGSVSFGLDSSETGTISLNSGGVVNDPGTIVCLEGRLIFESNAATSPDTFPISHIVADTLCSPIWDTIHTACLALTVANTGNFGNRGIGGVNMDYVAFGDCDSTAAVYVNDGSPVVGYVKDSDTIVNFSIFKTTYIDESGLVPLGNHTPTTDSGDYELFKSGKFVTHDSLIAIEKAWYAPKPSDSSQFMIGRLMIYLNCDTSVTGLRVGEAIDWNIPSDSAFDNGSGFDSDRNLIYQFGGEYNQDDSTECQDNDHRFGGIAFLDRYLNGIQVPGPPHGAYTADNAAYVYPNQAFVPEELYAGMQDSGYSLFSSAHPDSQLVDLHTVMTFDIGLALTSADTFVYYIEFVTIQDGILDDLQSAVDAGTQWYLSHFNSGCCQNRGNADGIGAINVGDVTYLTDFLFFDGLAPPCEEEGNADGTGGINVGDLTYLINYIFFGGPSPPPC
jgi:hypothetical protein